MKFTKWVRVIESDTVPKFTATVNGLFLKEEGNETVPLGNRVVEMPEDTNQTNLLRNPRSGFVAYVPIGSVKKGETLVTTGGATLADGKPVQARPCDPAVRDVPWPGTQGRGRRHSPDCGPVGQLSRACHVRLQARHARGTATALMKPTVEKLTEDDVIAIVAYVSSLEP